MATSLTIASPRPYMTFQRDGSDQADIVISGAYYGTVPTAMEASWNGGAWTNISATYGAGTYAGVLPDQAAGQGTLSVRDAGTLVQINAGMVGIGDVFVVAGQSNAAGRGDAYNAYSHATLKATMFRQDDAWRELSDPTDTEADLGSPWPFLATYIMAETGYPVAFITTGKGGTTLVADTLHNGQASWAKPGAEYSDCVQTATLSRVNAVKCLLWFQGENDATGGATYQAYIDAFTQMIADLRADVPALATTPIMACQIGHIDETIYSVTAAQIDTIRAAHIALWDAATALPGPLTYDVNLSDGGGTADGIHFRTVAELQLQADRWWRMLEYAFYGGAAGRSARVESMSLHDSSTVDLLFDSDITGETVAGWSLTDALGAIPLTSASIIASRTLRIICGRVLSGTILASFASGNTGLETTLVDTAATPMPIEPIYNLLVASVNVASNSWWR